MTDHTCSNCGGTRLEEGFVEDSGEAAKGFARWIPGPLEQGPLGGAKRFGKLRLNIAAYRCADCTHLELFAVSD